MRASQAKLPQQQEGLAYKLPTAEETSLKRLKRRADDLKFLLSNAKGEQKTRLESEQSTLARKIKQAEKSAKHSRMFQDMFESSLLAISDSENNNNFETTA